MATGDADRPQPPRAAVEAAARHEIAAASKNLLAVVAIGIADHNLEPIRLLFSEIGPGSGLAFLLVCGHEPAESGVLAALSDVTTLPVTTVAGDTVLAPDHVYVLERGIGVVDGPQSLRLLEKTDNCTQRPIDAVLQSLERAIGPRGIGILLSGTATDGGQGLEALKRAGGLTIMQDPDEAANDSRPRHVLMSARPHYVVPAKDIPKILRHYIADEGHRSIGAPELSGAKRTLHTGFDYGFDVNRPDIGPETPDQQLVTRADPGPDLMHGVDQRSANPAGHEDFSQPLHLNGDRGARRDHFPHLGSDFLDMADRQVPARGGRRGTAQATRASSHVLAAAIHDIRQPLQSIRLLQGVLEQQVVSPLAHVTLSRLGAATEELVDLTDALLEFHEIETGQLPIDLSEFPVAPILSQVRNQLRAAADAKGLDLRLVATSASVSGDRRLLARILGILVSQAIKQTDKGKILIGCRRAGANLCVEVLDTSLGISPERLRAMRDELEDRDGMKPAWPGLGLGLHMVKRYAELLDCPVDLRSEPGKGTRFALVVPAVQASNKSSSVGRLPAEGAQFAPGLLLIQEEATQRAALASLLEQHGYRVACARDAAEARASTRTGFEPNVIVADLDRPDRRSADEIVQQLRENERRSIPVLLLCDRIPDHGRKGEADGILHLSKPVKPMTLLAAIEALARRTMPDWHPTGTSRPALAELPSASDPRSEIAVIDNEPSVRVAVQAMLEAQGYKVETFVSGEAFLADPERRRFQCLVVDVSLPGMDGLDLQARLKTDQRRQPIVFLTGAGGVPLAVRAMREGATDFLQKPVDRQTLRESIGRAMAQDPSSDPSQPEVAEIQARLATLTKRERQIMDRIVIGQLNKNIAFELHISERTTEHHRQCIMRKMGVKSLAMLVRMIAMVENKRS